MKGDYGLPNLANKTALLVYFGQQVVEEMLDAQRQACIPEYFNIQINETDPLYGGIYYKYIPLPRTRFDFRTGQAPGNARDQFNEVSSWIDGTLMYGPFKAWTDVLREFKDGRLSENPLTPGYPPDNTVGLPIVNPPVPYFHKLMNAKRFMLFGNPRTNENPMLLSMATLWFRTHNYHADRLKAQHPTWSDEALFLEARKWTVAEHQHMVLDEWLPRWLQAPVPAYTQYKPYIVPTISQEFQTAAMRFGHTLVTPGVYRRDANCTFYNTTSKLSNDPNKIAFRTCNVFFRGREFLQETEDGWERLIQGMASQIAERDDNVITEDLRGFVFGPLEASRRDLMAINIQRGREHGMTDFNSVRKAFGLPPYATFADINPNTPEVTKALETIYGGDINKIDLWAGGIVETTSTGPGETFRTILLDQFLRIRDGDRFWFENPENGFFNSTELQQIKNLTMYDLVMRVAKFPMKLQPDPFTFTAADHASNQCFQPKQLVPGDLEKCTPPRNFDYYDDTDSGYDILWILLFGAGGWICLLVIVAYYAVTKFARVAVSRERDIAKQRSKTVRQIVPPRDDASTMSYGAILYDDAKIEPVFLTHDENHIVISTKSRIVIREVAFSRIMDMTWSDCVLLIRVPSEFDILVSFGEPSRAHTYMGVLHNDIRAGLNVSISATESASGTEGLFATARSHKDHTMRLKAFVGFALRKIMAAGVTVGEQLPVDADEVTLYRDASKFSMSHDTFAEAFQLPRNSIFVDRIFQLADRHGNGYISFAEFVDVMAILINGTSSQKLRLLFEMYDVDHNGTISYEEMRTMVRSTMEMTNLVTNTESKIDEVLNAMLESAGFSSSQTSFDFKAFTKIMGVQDGVASRFGLKAGAINARFGDEALPKISLGTKPKDAAIAESATEMGSGSNTADLNDDEDDGATPLSAVVRGYTTMGQTMRQTLRAGEKPLNGVVDKPRKLTAWERTHRWMLERRLGIFWTWIITVATLGTFAERAYTYSFEREHGGLRSIAGYGVTVTRGAASSIMFRSSVLLLPVCRNTITWLRGTVVNRIIPFDGMIGFHKVNALGALLFVFMHIVGHMFNFYCITTQPPADSGCLFREVSWESDFLPSFHWWVFKTVTGVSGFMATLITVAIFLFALPFARRLNFNLFWYTHNLYPLYYFLMLLHGAAQLVQQPIFWLYFLGPGCLFVVDKLASYSVLSRDIQVVEAQILPAGVLKLEFHRPKDFKFISGQWVRIRCNAVSKYETHPFTITSAPHEKYLQLYIRVCGPWTSKIYDMYKAAVDNGDDLPTINVEGPYGEAYQQWSNFHISILIGGGIGVTPFVSIIKDYLHQCKVNESLIVRKLYFLWICRTQKQFEWVIDVLRELEEADQEGHLEIHVFITELNENFDLRTSLLYICERQFHKINGCSLFTGLQAPTHFGRPKFETIIRQIMYRHTEEKIIAIFSCGSHVMTGGVFEAIEAIRAAPRPEDPVLNHKSLNF